MINGHSLPNKWHRVGIMLVISTTEGKKVSPTLQQLDVFWAQLSTGGMTEMLGHSPVGIVTDVENDDDDDGWLLTGCCWRLPLK